jgi:hypothetical protein
MLGVEAVALIQTLLVQVAQVEAVLVAQMQWVLLEL